jgi:predicted RND superfamily exporter protein
VATTRDPNDHPNAFIRFVDRMLFGHRPLVLIVFAAITVAMAFFAAQLKIDAGFKKQIPLKHEYMKTFLDYEKDFGGANRILIAVMDKHGNMFNLPFFQTLQKVTTDASKIDHADPSRISSIFTPNVRFVEVVEDGFAGGNVIPDSFTPDLPGFQPTPEQFATIKANIEKAGVVGRFVAKDFSGAMVWVDLVPEDPARGIKIDYDKVNAQLEAIRHKYENADTTVAVIGFAKMVGDISAGAKSVIKFFLFTIAFTWLLLFAYSASTKLATLTVTCALIAVIWMLGALHLLGFGIDPMNMLTPFLIFAIAVSHGEQMINRFRGELFFGGLEEGSVEDLRQRQGVNAETAARLACHMLLVPGAVALMAGCIGFATILIIPVRIIFELAVTATVGVALIVFTNLLLLPVLLSYTRLRNLDRKRAWRLRQLTQFDKLWTVLAKLSRPVPAAVVILIGLAMWAVAAHYGSRVMIGDAQKGVAELRPDSRYNRDAALISDKFALGVDILNVIAEVAPNACTTSYPVMETLDRFAWNMRNVPGVAQVITLPMAAKIVNAGWNEGNLRWRELPRDNDALRQDTQGFETDSGLLNGDCSAMPVMMFLTDHRATTIDSVIAAVKKFRADNDAFAGPDVNLRAQLSKEFNDAQAQGKTFVSNRVNLRLATGNVGVMAAINDEVRAVDHTMLYLLYAAVFVMCLLSFRNPLAALCIVLPLVLVTELGHSLMVEMSIGKKVNTLTVLALGVGVGVDYAIYIFARMREAMQQGKSLTESYFIALKTTGIAVFYTALTLAVGVGLWIFSDLKFQADMGVLLTFMFVVNMIAAIVFLPALCRWLLRPRERSMT